MKVVSSDDKITIYTCVVEDTNINDYIKNLILKLKRKYRIKMCGFYQINVYKNSKVGMIIDIIKEDDMDYFNDLVDLRIKIYDNSDIYFSFSDYFLNIKKDVNVLNNKYYIDVNLLTKEEFLLMTEFCNYVYGKELDTIKDKLKAFNNLTN